MKIFQIRNSNRNWLLVTFQSTQNTFTSPPTPIIFQCNSCVDNKIPVVSMVLKSTFLSYRGLSVMDPGAGSKRPCLRLANGRVNSGDVSSEPPPPTVAPVPALCRHDSIKISIDNTNTCTDSVVTALGDPVNDYITPEINFKKVSLTFFYYFILVFLPFSLLIFLHFKFIAPGVDLNIEMNWARFCSLFSCRKKEGLFFSVSPKLISRNTTI